MARGVDKVKLIGLPIQRLVIQRDALRLDGDAALALQIHGIEHLRSHFTVGQATANLDNAVRQRRLTVVNMGNNGEISYMLHYKSFSALVFLNYSPIETRMDLKRQ
ncbi:Uncharacterised protein [Acinetobacter baumannii]|nr:Uncharacterised protein [Acinetobacter baumannii]